MTYIDSQYPRQLFRFGRGSLIVLLVGSFLLVPLSLFGQKNQPSTYQSISTTESPASVPADSSWLDIFGYINGIYNSPYAIATDGNNVYVGGSFNEAGNQTNLNNIARWDGTQWNRMGSGMDGWVRAIAVNGTGIYAGGAFKFADGKEANGIARWDGTTWQPLGSGVDGEVWAIAINGTDVYVGGRFENAGGQPAPYIAKWTGTHWESLGSGVDGTVSSIVTYGTLVCVSGSFSQAGGIAANKLAQWDGIRWQAMGAGPNDYVYTLAVSGNTLYAGGQFTVMDGHTANYIAKWNGTNWQSLADSVKGNSVFALAMMGKELFLGGELSKINQQPISNLAKWDAVQWQPLGSGVNGVVRGFAVNGLDVYVIGSFSLAGGKSCYNIACWHNPPPLLASFAVTGNPAPDGVAATDSVVWTVEAKDSRGNILFNYANPPLSFWVNNSSATQEQWKVGYTNKRGQYIKSNTISDSIFQDGIALLRTFTTLAENIPISFSFRDTNGITGTTPLFSVIPGPIVALDIFPYDISGKSVRHATWNGSDGQPDTVFAELEFPFYVRRLDRYRNVDVLSPPIEVIVTTDKSGSVSIGESPVFVKTEIPYAAWVINRTTDRFRLLALWNNKYFSSDTIVVNNTTSIQRTDRIPTTISLDQNYPNPFNPTTKITFQIPSPHYVTLRIYDVLGREVATLVDERLQAGMYEVPFSGERLPSGVYYYRLSMEGFTATKKMILLK